MLEPLLGVEPLLLGEAAVVGGDVLVAEPVSEQLCARHPLGQPAGVDEDQCGAMRLDQLRQASIDLLPDFGRHHRFERRVRNFEREVARAAVAGVDDRAIGARRAVRAGADQKARHRFDRLLGGGEADALQPAAAERGEAFERKRQMGAALVRRHRVDLVDDHGAGGRQHRAPDSEPSRM